MSDLVYESSVYTRTVKYTNFKGKTQETELFFALDPLSLLQLIASFNSKPVKKSKSGNPSKQNEPAGVSDEDQLKFIQDLASRSAGFPSEDGETWEPFENFADTIAGKAFLTKLASSDSDRKEFAKKVIIDPFAAFVSYAEADPSNTPREVQEMKTMLAQIERLFLEETKDESLEERRARLAAELEKLNESHS